MTTIPASTEPAALRKLARELLVCRAWFREQGMTEKARDAQRTARQYVRKARAIEKAQHAAAERRLTEIEAGTEAGSEFDTGRARDMMRGAL